jgi:hypothetical protein
VIQTCLYLYRKFDLWQFLVELFVVALHKIHQPPSHFLPQLSMYSEQRKSLRQTLKHILLLPQQLNLAHNCAPKAFPKANYHLQVLAKQSGQDLPGAGAGIFNPKSMTDKITHSLSLTRDFMRVLLH